MALTFLGFRKLVNTWATLRVSTFVLLVSIAQVNAAESHQGAQAAPQEVKGLFWKAESPKGSAYLLGSIHFGREDFYPLRNNIMQAFESSPVLLVEMDDQRVTLSEQQKILMSTVAYQPGDSLQQHVSSKTLDLIEERLKEFGVPLEAVQKFRPGFVGIMLAGMQASALGYVPEKGIDYYFMNLARGKKPILEMESFQQQMNLISSIPEDDLAIRETFAQMDDYRSMWKDMESAWVNGDAERLYQVAIAEPLMESPEFKPVYDVLFYQRNGPMADKVEQCIARYQTCFVVVGAGHLVGADSVTNKLGKRGYKIQQQ